MKTYPIKHLQEYADDELIDMANMATEEIIEWQEFLDMVLEEQIKRNEKNIHLK
jgi:hypothetical protein